MEFNEENEPRSCSIKLRSHPQRRRETVFVGCGAGFAGDRPLAALKLLQRVKELNYLVLECLAERTLVDRYHAMVSGGHGYDPRISEWMALLLPLAVEGGTCIITNMGAMDPIGAQKKVLEVASKLGLTITVAVAREVAVTKSGSASSTVKSNILEGGISTYLGAAPIVECLDMYRPEVIITSRVADAALFLAPMVYELGWNWNDLELLAQGSLAGHLLECGCQLTGGYFIHAGDKYRTASLACQLDLSLPFAEISYGGQLSVAKADGSGGLLNFSTCAEQLLYEIGDPGAYITPDVVIDIRDVSFQPLSDSKVLCIGAKPSTGSAPDHLLQLIPKDCGWKGWGEISYGGHDCVIRAEAAEFLVRSWMEEAYPSLNNRIISYVIGLDSLKATSTSNYTSDEKDIEDIRLRMDGLFEIEEHAVQFSREFTALYTNGPAGGGGISTGHKKEIMLGKELVGRQEVFYQTGAQCTKITNLNAKKCHSKEITRTSGHRSVPPLILTCRTQTEAISSEIDRFPAPSGQKIPLYKVAHSRAGDKGNDSNFSIIPHFPADIERLKLIITPQWVKTVVSPLLSTSSFPDTNLTGKSDERDLEHVKVEIYEVNGIHSLNVVVRDILDGGANCSRRIDRHGKSISDLILCQQVMIPPS